MIAVAFLPVFYSHLALNDVPTLAPLCAALIGIAGIYRTGRTREYVLAGLGLGVAIATKYTAGIVLVTLVAAGAVVLHAAKHWRRRNVADTSQFRATLTVGCSAIATLAIVWQGFAFALMPPCA